MFLKNIQIIDYIEKRIPFTIYYPTNRPVGSFQNIALMRLLKVKGVKFIFNVPWIVLEKGINNNSYLTCEVLEVREGVRYWECTDGSSGSSSDIELKVRIKNVS